MRAPASRIKRVKYAGNEIVDLETSGLSMRVLVVEDTDDVRELLKRMLETLGHEVSEAAGGRAALAVALKEQPDLILMDLSMPDVNGLQATGALRAISGL